ncbi:MAG: large repetitive protein [Gaiellaceae bacterium]|nr:large repetitive protein [Gaiellaceae bacterium]
MPFQSSGVCLSAAVAAALLATLTGGGAAKAGTFTRFDASAAIEAESVPELPDLTALKSTAETEALKWVTSRELMQQMFKQRAKASKTTPDRLMLYLARQVTPSPPGADLRFVTLQLIGNQMSNYIGIRGDAPDPSYAQITPLAARQLFRSDDLDGADHGFSLYAPVLSAETTLAQALLRSLARYQGADADGNGAWALVHARAIREYASALASQLDQTVAGMQLMRFVFDSDPRPIDAQIAELKEWRNRVAANGAFSVAELREAANLGIGQNQLDAMKANLLQDDWNLSRASVVAHMDELVTAHAALKPTLIALAAEMAPLIAQLETDPLVPDLAPIANAGGPYAGAQNATISFTAGASTSPSAITAYAWDLDGDGAFDDATGVNPTSSFSTARNSTIGVRVTNADGQADVASTRLEVTGGGGGVTLDDFSPFRVGSQFIGEASVRVGETQAFSVTSPNANHYIWLLDTLFTGTSGVPTYSLTPTAAQIGAHVVKVIVTSGANASLSINWDVAVLAPDGDGDLWNANADCDDADADVHPLRDEILGNGKDDDCNPATADASTNVPPVATDLSLTTAEDTPLPIVLAGTDADGGTVVAAPASTPAHGVFEDGVYTPALNFNGTDSFTFLVTDGQGGSDSGTVTITVTPVNDPPEPFFDEVFTPENTPASGNVLVNDLDPDGDALTVTLESSPAHGAASLQANGDFLYTPAAGYVGLDEFSYRAGDGQASEVAFVKIVVTPAGEPPVAPDQSVTTAEDTPLSIALAATDPDGGTPTIAVTDQPDHGSYAAGVYTPNLDFNGADSFVYTATDTDGQADTGTVTITVTPVNDAPVAVADSYATDADGVLDLAAPGVLANDTDVDGDGDALVARLVDAPTVVLQHFAFHADGSVQLLPKGAFEGPVTFSYETVDATGAASAPATVTVAVTAVNHVPFVANLLLVTDEDTPLSAIGLVAHDGDGDALTITTTQPTHGSYAGGVGGTYTPAANYNGPDSFTYTADDGRGGTATATVNIDVRPVNDPPEWEVAPPSQVTLRPNTLLNFDVIGRDVDGSDIVFGATTAGCENPAEKFGPNFYFDTEFFPFQGVVLDAGVPRRESSTLTIHTKPGAALGTYCLKLLLAEDGASVVRTLSIVVTSGIPTAVPDSYATDEDTTLTVPAPGVLANDTDPEGDPLATALVTGPAHGRLTLESNGSFEYAPAPNFNGSDEFTYLAVDPSGNASQPAKVSLSINPVSDRPEWESTPSPITIEPDSTLTVDVIGRDADGSDMEFFINFTIAGACVNPAVPGGPAFQDDTGLLPFEGVVLDAGVPRRESATLTIHTKPGVAAGTYCLRLMVSDADSGVARIVSIVIADSSPVAASDSYMTDEDVTLARPAPGVLANDTDANGDPLTADLVQGPAHGTLTLALNGSFEYVPAPNFNGTDEFTYRAIDPSGNASAPVKASVSIKPVNDAPDVDDRSVTTAQGAPVTIALAGTDVDGDALTITHTAPAHGDFNGSTYTPAAGYSGPDSFTYTANDGHGGTDTATVSITVTPTNPPVDTTPPTCTIVEQGKTAAGNAFIRFQVNDVGLGLASHKVTYLRNATVKVDAYLPGSLGPVYVKATAVDKRQSFGVQVDFLDRGGNIAICDPIVLSVVREDDKLQDETFSNVPQAESRVSIYNGKPGMKKVVIIVNGKKFKEVGLKANEVRTFDVSSAMKPGPTNTITVRVRGKKGASALIVIADIP